MNLKYFIPSNLLGRTILIVIFPILMFQIIILSYYYNSLWERTLLRLSRSVAMEIAFISNSILENEISLKSFEDKFDQFLRMKVEIIDKENFSTNKTIKKQNIVLSSFKSELNSLIKYNFYLSEDFKNRNISVFILLENHILRFQFPIDRITTSRNHIFLGWQIISSLLLIIIAFIFLKNQIKPIINLAKAAERFGKGQEDDFKISGASEVRLASLEFIKMKNRINKQIEQRSMMLAGVSHDLKTPLTRMRLQTESIKDQSIKKFLNDEIHQMTEMLNEYLDFSSSDKIENGEVADPINLINKIVNDINFKEHDIEIKIVENKNVTVNSNIFNRVIINLLNNAIAVASKIEVQISINNQFIGINIHDNGPGINDEEKLNVFKPFYRLDKGRNQNRLNSGLGLSITKSLLSKINGDIKLKDSYLGGLEVAIKIENK